MAPGSWGAQDPSLLWLSKALDDAKDAFIRQQEENGTITQASALALVDFAIAHCQYLESYVHHYHKPYLASARRMVAHYRSLFQGARARAQSQQRHLDKFISAMMPSLSGYRGELLSLTELPHIRIFGFHFDDVIGTTQQSLLRETKDFHQKILAALPSRLKQASDQAFFDVQYPWLSYVVRNELSKQDRFEKLLHWITHEKEFDFLLRSDGRYVIIEVKNRKDRVGVKDLTHPRKRSRGVRTKSMLQQFDELVEIQMLLAGGPWPNGKAPFGVAAYFPNSISLEAEALLKRHGISVIPSSVVE